MKNNTLPEKVFYHVMPKKASLNLQCFYTFTFAKKVRSAVNQEGTAFRTEYIMIFCEKKCEAALPVI